MVDSEGHLCFPDDHALGLDVLVRVVRNTTGVQPTRRGASARNKLSATHLQVPNHGRLWKSLMRAYLGDYEAVDNR